MKYTDNAINIITTMTFKGVGRAWIFKNLKGNESVNDIISKMNKSLRNIAPVTTEIFSDHKNEILKKIEILNEYCDGVVALGDNEFPIPRGNIKASEQPVFLFYKGKLNLLNIKNNNVAVIGFLNPTENIVSRERKLVSEIVKRHITIVSGLAFGCDSIAHQEALKGGSTIAILPSPLNSIMPIKNKELASDIIKNGGLLITEYYDTHKSSLDLNSRYKDRDRLQALYSDAIILVASYSQDSSDRSGNSDKKLDTGARLAMQFAKNYGIARAVMYNENIDNEDLMFDLNRKLIAEQSNITILNPKNLNKLIDDIISNNNNRFRNDLLG